MSMRNHRLEPALVVAFALLKVASNLQSQGTPSIAIQPISQGCLQRATTTFSVKVTGDGPFTYQWRFNSTNIPNVAIINTVAGNGVMSSGGDGGMATNASLFSPTSDALDAAGILLRVRQHSCHLSF